MKYREATGVFCDKKSTIKVKKEVFKTILRPVIMCGSECWAIKKRGTYNESCRDENSKIKVWCDKVGWNKEGILI